MSRSDIRAGIVANLRTQWPDGVQIGKTILANPTPPTLQVRAGAVDYDQALGRGMDDVTMIVQGIVALNDAGQLQLDAWLDGGAGGVKHAVELDRSAITGIGTGALGGSVDDCQVTNASETVVATIGGREVLLVEWTVTCLPRGA